MQRTVHIILTTHWDREWIQSFEQYRYRLVRLFDAALDILERETDLTFVADGQTIMLEDYLAVCPHQEPRVRALAQAGRLVFGPWYILSDQFLECDEAMVRNLLTGHAIASEYGGAMREGYVPDSFGSIAALPAVLNGFGIRTANLKRGSQRGRIHRDKHLFRWRWLDGSEVLALDVGYGNGLPITYPDIWRNISRVVPTPETAVRAAQDLIEHQGPSFATPSIYASSGADHLPLRPGMSGIIAALNAAGNHTFISSTPERYFRMVMAELDAAVVELETVSGEMRGDTVSPMPLQGVLSTDVRLKQANRNAELQLIRLFEPLSAASHGLGYDHTHVLRRAWKLLLAVHPHDSICACSDDNTMDDIHARVRQVRELSDIATERLLNELLPATPATQGMRPVIALFHGLPARGSDGFNLLVRMPLRLHEPAYTLLDAGGRAAGLLHVLGHRQMDLETFFATDHSLMRLDCKSPNAERTDDTVYTICRAEGVTDFGAWSGFQTFTLAPASLESPNYAASASHIENDLLALDIAADGQLTLTRKADGRSADSVGWYEDMADAGNTYDYLRVSADTPRYSYQEARVYSRLLRNDAWASELEVITEWNLPARLEGWTWPARRVWPPSEVSGRRSDELLTHRIVAVYRLRPGLGRLEADIRFENQAVNHRLRFGMRVPRRDPYTTGAHFTVLERDWHAPTDIFPTRPMVDWLRLGNGLVFASAGLYEAEARALPGDGGEVLVTLCRSVDCVGIGAGCNYEDVRNPLELGEHTYRCALAFADSPAAAAGLAAAFLSPVIAHGCMLSVDEADPGLPGRVLSVDNPALVVSACKRAEANDGTVIRLWNTGGQVERCTLRWGLPYRQAVRCELSEAPSARPAPREASPGTFELEAGPYEIITIKLADR